MNITINSEQEKQKYYVLSELINFPGEVFKSVNSSSLLYFVTCPITGNKSYTRIFIIDTISLRITVPWQEYPYNKNDADIGPFVKVTGYEIKLSF